MNNALSMAAFYGADLKLAKKLNANGFVKLPQVMPHLDILVLTEEVQAILGRSGVTPMIALAVHGVELHNLKPLIKDE